MADTKTTLTWLLKDQVSGPAKNINTVLGKAETKATGSAGAFGKLGGAVGGFVNPTTLAIGAGVAMVGFMGGAIKAAADEKINIEKLTASLKANVPGWDGNTASIEDLISSRERLGFSDDEQRDSLAQLLAGTNDVKEAQDLQALAMDLARLKGVDLATATDAVSKANAGSTRELKALGIEVDAGASKTEVFAAIQKAAAGQAEAYAKTTAGKWEALQIKIGDLVEDVGTFLLPIMETLLDFALNDLIPALAGIADVVGPVIGGAFAVMGGIITWWVQNIITPLITVLKKVVEWARAAFGWIGDVVKAAGTVTGAVGGFIAGGNKIDYRAEGGPVQAGRPYIVGEQGPELFMPSSSGSIIPNGGAAGASMVPVQIPIIIDGREIARVVDERLYLSALTAGSSLSRS
jgi:hypothetical protein